MTIVQPHPQKRKRRRKSWNNVFVWEISAEFSIVVQPVHICMPREKHIENQAGKAAMLMVLCVWESSVLN